MRSLQNSTALSPKNGNFNFGAGMSVDAEVLAKIEKYTLEANEIMKANYLKEIWSFEDLHKDHLAPSYVHRVRNRIVKHI